MRCARIYLRLFRSSVVQMWAEIQDTIFYVSGVRTGVNILLYRGFFSNLTLQ